MDGGRSETGPAAGHAFGTEGSSVRADSARLAATLVQSSLGNSAQMQGGGAAAGQSPVHAATGAGAPGYFGPPRAGLQHSNKGALSQLLKSGSRGDADPPGTQSAAAAPQLVSSPRSASRASSPDSVEPNAVLDAGWGKRGTDGRHGSAAGPQADDGHVAEALPVDERGLTTRLPRWMRSSRKHMDARHLAAEMLHGSGDVAQRLPAVLLGLLLNILDALSYGMILFPLSTDEFAGMEGDGISVFYVSTIICQVIFSLGMSQFRGAVGSEMIEIVPFFHQMANTVAARVGEGKHDTVMATTMMAFAISSVMTGLAFLLLGALRLGRLISFFPRHILVGCVGGVGFFLMLTGLEVSARMPHSVEFDRESFDWLFSSGRAQLWMTPLVLAIVLETIQHFYTHPMILPVYFCLVPIVFYVVVAAIPGLTMEQMRQYGWVFQAPATRTEWYHFYTYYNFSAIDGAVLLETLPAMFAVTFFALLHVPINVPALALSTGVDSISLNRELFAHGVTNSISGLMGTVQNYLVYSNSLLVIRCGGDSRISGMLLALGTTGVMCAGPGLIAYIPVMLVGALIFLLGIELLKEALWDTWNRLHRFEYLTVVAIVLFMGMWDFVYGILIGIILACVFMVVQASRRHPVRGLFYGTHAKSTVRRPPLQQKFLARVGDQIAVCRLGGFMFFGTISAVEKQIRHLVDDRTFHRKPIRFLILDCKQVTGLDFSAAEAFVRMRRILAARQVHLCFCGIDADSDIDSALRSVGLIRPLSDTDSGDIEQYSTLSASAHSEGKENDNTYSFANLNMALEACENYLLEAVNFQQLGGASMPSTPCTTASLRLSGRTPDEPPDHLDPVVPADFDAMLTWASSPRQSNLRRAAVSTLTAGGGAGAGDSARMALQRPLAAAADASRMARIHEQPEALILQLVDGLSDAGREFWINIARQAFTRIELAASTLLYRRGDRADDMYIVEDGVVSALYSIAVEGSRERTMEEHIVAGTIVGELPFLSDTPRTADVVTETACVLWRMNRRDFNERLTERERAELLRLGLKLTSERIAAMTDYAIIGQ